MKRILALCVAFMVAMCCTVGAYALDEPRGSSSENGVSKLDNKSQLNEPQGSSENKVSELDNTSQPNEPQGSSENKVSELDSKSQPNEPQGSSENAVTDFDYQGQLDALGADELLNQLPQDAKNLMENAGLDSIDYKQLLSLSPSAFLQEIWRMVMHRIRQPLRVFGALLGTVLLCAMLQSLQTSLGDTTLTGVFSAVSIVCIAGAIAAPIVECITTVARTVNECANFVATFIPIFASVVTVGGQPATATTYTAFLFMACQVVSQIVSGTFVPLMGIYLAFCIAGNLAPGVNLAAVAQGVRQVVNWALGLLLTLFVALLSLQTAVASSGDHVMSKTARFLIGSFIPVVGGALGDAMIAAQGYMSVLKTTLGAFGILAALLCFLPIFLQTVIWYLTVNLSAAAAETLGVGQAAQILKSASAVLGVLMAVVLCFALLIIISTSLVLGTVGG